MTTSKSLHGQRHRFPLFFHSNFRCKLCFSRPCFAKWNFSRASLVFAYVFLVMDRKWVASLFEAFSNPRKYFKTNILKKFLTSNNLTRFFTTLLFYYKRVLPSVLTNFSTFLQCWQSLFTSIVDCVVSSIRKCWRNLTEELDLKARNLLKQMCVAAMSLPMQQRVGENGNPGFCLRDAENRGVVSTVGVFNIISMLNLCDINEKFSKQ